MTHLELGNTSTLALTLTLYLELGNTSTLTLTLTLYLELCDVHLCPQFVAHGSPSGVLFELLNGLDKGSVVDDAEVLQEFELAVHVDQRSSLRLPRHPCVFPEGSRKCLGGE